MTLRTPSVRGQAGDDKRSVRPVKRGVRPAASASGTGRVPRSENSAYDRGTPIDRINIEPWIASRRAAISGVVLEVKGSDLVTTFGSKLTHVDVVDIDPSNENATIVADLAEAGSLPANRYGCAVIVQTLQYVSSPIDAVSDLIDALAPEGSLLLVVPGVEPTERGSLANDRWRFLIAGVESIVEVAREGRACEHTIEAFGNAATVLGIAAGTVAEEGFDKYLGAHDSHYPVVICAAIAKLRWRCPARGRAWP